MEKVRAKFFVSGVNKATSQVGGNTITTVKMHPVYSSDPDSENKVFTDATPCGEFTMGMTVPETADFFEPGQEYYLDFTRA